MSAAHSHGHGGSGIADQEAFHDHFRGSRDVRAAQRGRMRWVLGLTAAFMLAEVAGGVLANSLALLADAGHMFTDVAALGLSLVAMTLAQRPPSPTKTYGYVRLEILAALINGSAPRGYQRRARFFQDRSRQTGTGAIAFQPEEFSCRGTEDSGR